MAGKGSGRRLAEIADYKMQLKWALQGKETDDETKEEILNLLEIEKNFQIQIADIRTSDENRDIFKKIITGELPVIGTYVGDGKKLETFFPWSDNKEVVKIVKDRKYLITKLVTVGDFELTSLHDDTKVKVYEQNKISG